MKAKKLFGLLVLATTVVVSAFIFKNDVIASNGFDCGPSYLGIDPNAGAFILCNKPAENYCRCGNVLYLDMLD
jgi:hypothetical protein